MTNEKLYFGRDDNGQHLLYTPLAAIPIPYRYHIYAGFQPPAHPHTPLRALPVGWQHASGRHAPITMLSNTAMPYDTGPKMQKKYNFLRPNFFAPDFFLRLSRQWAMCVL